VERNTIMYFFGKSTVQSGYKTRVFIQTQVHHLLDNLQKKISKNAQGNLNGGNMKLKSLKGKQGSIGMIDLQSNSQ